VGNGEQELEAGAVAQPVRAVPSIDRERCGNTGPAGPCQNPRHVCIENVCMDPGACRSTLAIGRWDRDNGEAAIFIEGGQERTRGEDWDNGPTKRGVRAMAFGNVDDDPWDELVVTRDDGGARDASGNARVVIYDDVRTNYDERDWLAKGDWGRQHHATAVAVGDVDGDDIGEIVLGRNADGDSNGRVIVLDDHGADYQKLTSVADWGEGVEVTALATADVDGDGDDEIAVGRNYDPQLLFYDFDGTALTEIYRATGWSTTVANDLAFANLDGDALPELVVAESDEEYGVLVIDDFEHGFAVTKVETEFGPGRRATEIAVGDLDADGAKELIVGRNDDDGSDQDWHLILFEPTGVGLGYTKARAFPDHWGPGRKVTDLAVADFDGDGLEEFAVARNAGGNWRTKVFQNLSETDVGDAPDPWVPSAPEYGASWGEHHGAAALAVGNRVCKAPPHEVPAEDEVQGLTAVEAADTEFSRRLAHLVRRYLRDLPRNQEAQAYELPPDQPGEDPQFDDADMARKIAAGLVALKLQQEQENKAVAELFPAGVRVQPAFPALVTSWLQNNRVRLKEKVGTRAALIGEGEGDGDFVLLRVLGLLYAFRENPELLPPDAALELLALCGSDEENDTCRDIMETCTPDGDDCVVPAIPLLGNHVSHLTRQYASSTFPETENHVLMINAWRFLANQYVRQNRHGDPRLAEILRRSARVVGPLGEREDGCSAADAREDPLDNERCSLADALISMLRRVVMDDFFETNARPYNGYSTLAILLLASYADDSVPGSKSARVKQAAQNAMNFAATKFAFQSHFGKRSGHQRRNWDSASNRGIFTGDRAVPIWGMLSGAYTYNDEWDCDFFPASVEERPLPWFGCAYSGESTRGFALDAALASGLVARWVAPGPLPQADEPEPPAVVAIRESRYRIPTVIHDFTLRPDNGSPGYGFWARMQARYTDDHYEPGSRARYPVPFPDGDNDDWEAAMRDGRRAVIAAPEFYFGTARFMNAAGGSNAPYSQGGGSQYPDATKWDYYTFSKPTLLIPNGNAFWDNNVWYETLAMAGARDVPHESTNLGVYKNIAYGYLGQQASRITLPPTWRCAASFALQGYPVCVVDHSGDGSFIVLVSMANSDLGPRGIWEVIPVGANGLDSVAAIQAAMTDTEFGGYYDLTELGSNYQVQYVSLVSGEVLRFSWRENDPLLAIDGDESLVDARHRTVEPRRMPLIDVAQVDESFAFTGRTYAASTGNGKVWICNPDLGRGFLIDSSSHEAPSTSPFGGEPVEGCGFDWEAAWAELPPLSGSVGWHARRGSVQVVSEPRTEGVDALRMTTDGSGFAEVVSPEIAGAILAGETALRLDALSAGTWDSHATLTLYLDVPGAGLQARQVGAAMTLVTLQTGVFETDLRFLIPDDLRDAFEAGHAGTLRLVLRAPAGTSVVVDGLAELGAQGDALGRDWPGFTRLEDATWATGKVWPGSSTSLSVNEVDRTEGAGATFACGKGTQMFTSPAFRTGTLPELGTQVSVDVYLPENPPNPWWLGQLKLYYHDWPANLMTQPVGNPVELTGFTVGEWVTVSFTVNNPAIVADLEADRWGGFFQVELVTPYEATQCFGFDKLRFTGARYPQPNPAEPPELPPDSGPRLLGFEVLTDWAAMTSLSLAASPVVSGTAALRVPVQGYTVVDSRAFDSSELEGVTGRLGLEVFVPWGAQYDVQAFVSCPAAGVFNAYLGRVPLDTPPQGAYRHVGFDLPADVVGALTTSNTQCSWRLALNGNGDFLLDAMGFE